MGVANLSRCDGVCVCVDGGCGLSQTSSQHSAQEQGHSEETLAKDCQARHQERRGHWKVGGAHWRHDPCGYSVCLSVRVWCVYVCVYVSVCLCVVCVYVSVCLCVVCVSVFVCRAMDLLQECSLLKIEDVLPFFPDFVTIDHFKDAICTSLTEYNAHIEELKEEMKGATESAKNIRSDIQDIRNK